MSYGYYTWRRTPSRAARANARRQIAAAVRAGAPMSPVAIAGRTIARTFWGKAWCDNLERYRDFAHRLERGRTYARRGAVLDLQIARGQIRAKVSGTWLYDVAIDVDPVAPHVWRAIVRDCATRVASRLDLLGGKLSDDVMARLCEESVGLFPAPSAIRFTCTCPDYASMCKHVAASMYGVGARLDHAPELLFELRHVSMDDLVTSALSEVSPKRPESSRLLGTAHGELAAMFGIELEAPAIEAPLAKAPPIEAQPAPPTQPTPRSARRAKAAPPVPASRQPRTPNRKALMSQQQFDRAVLTILQRATRGRRR